MTKTNTTHEHSNCLDLPKDLDKQHSAVDDSVYCFDSINSEPKQLRKTEIYAKKKMPLIESLCSQKNGVCMSVHPLMIHHFYIRTISCFWMFVSGIGLCC